ncbi:RidA family protein [Curvibacter sp. RS43]|uniref:RidA family protein n=1 Tax=Curvibacter microcysteis TaxID=3026419 RepID=UPI0023622681|nr:RidA family protein [Curvibacter sp. RS43]MDD0812874.1 RidA family protein [Curvibacter sp. RS43]
MFDGFDNCAMSTTKSLPFSEIRRAAGLVFLSGELPFAADGSIPDGIEAQTRLTLQRIATTLSTVGLTLSDVVSCTVYLTDKDDFSAFNAAYLTYFSRPLPVRTTVCTGLVAPARIEISVIAAQTTA